MTPRTRCGPAVFRASPSWAEAPPSSGVMPAARVLRATRRYNPGALPAGVERLNRFNYSCLTDSSFDGRTSRAGRRAPSQSSAAATGRRRALRRRNTRPCRACWCSPLRGKKRSAAPGDDVELSFGSPRADACSCSRTPARAEVLVEHVEVDEEVHGVVACVNRRSGRLRTTTRRVREKRLLH